MHSARAYKMIFCFTAIIVLCLNVSDRCLDGRTTLHKATMLCVAPHGKTRKLCYRKEDRAMRPIYRCPENFRQSLTTPTVTFPHIFNRLLLR